MSKTINANNVIYTINEINSSFVFAILGKIQTFTTHFSMLYNSLFLPLVMVSLALMSIMAWIELIKASNKNFDKTSKAFIYFASSILANVSIISFIMAAGAVAASPYLFLASLGIVAIYEFAYSVISLIRCLYAPPESKEYFHFAQSAVRHLFTSLSLALMSVIVLGAMFFPLPGFVMISCVIGVIALNIANIAWRAGSKYGLDKKVKKSLGINKPLVQPNYNGCGKMYKTSNFFHSKYRWTQVNKNISTGNNLKSKEFDLNAGNIQNHNELNASITLPNSRSASPNPYCKRRLSSIETNVNSLSASPNHNSNYEKNVNLPKSNSNPMIKNNTRKCSESSNQSTLSNLSSAEILRKFLLRDIVNKSNEINNKLPKDKKVYGTNFLDAHSIYLFHERKNQQKIKLLNDITNSLSASKNPDFDHLKATNPKWNQSFFCYKSDTCDIIDAVELAHSITI